MRHYQTWNDWPHHSYDPFCIGTTYIFSGSGVRDLVSHSADVPWFNLEDHWVGAVMEKAGIGVKHVPGFNTQYYPNEDVSKYINWRRKKGYCNYDPNWYTLHRVLPKDIMTIYRTCLAGKM